MLVRMGLALEPRWADVDSSLLANSLLTVAEMLGRLAVSDPVHYPRERLQGFPRTLVRLVMGVPPSE
jgi:hypothetical protein